MVATVSADIGYGFHRYYPTSQHPESIQRPAAARHAAPCARSGVCSLYWRGSSTYGTLTELAKPLLLLLRGNGDHSCSSLDRSTCILACKSTVTRQTCVLWRGGGKSKMYNTADTGNFNPPPKTEQPSAKQCNEIHHRLLSVCHAGGCWIARSLCFTLMTKPQCRSEAPAEC